MLPVPGMTIFALLPLSLQIFHRIFQDPLKPRSRTTNKLVDRADEHKRTERNAKEEEEIKARQIDQDFSSSVLYLLS